MDRLTKRLPDNLGCVPVEGIGWPEISDRLAAYEDTGLEPEEIRESDKMLRAFIEHNRTTGYPRTLDWLLHITKAESEGRLIVLHDPEERGLPDIEDVCLVRIAPHDAPPFWTTATYCGEGDWETESAGFWWGPSVTAYAILQKFGPTIDGAEAALGGGEDG